VVPTVRPLVTPRAKVELALLVQSPQETVSVWVRATESVNVPVRVVVSFSLMGEPAVTLDSVSVEVTTGVTLIVVV